METKKQWIRFGILGLAAGGLGWLSASVHPTTPVTRLVSVVGFVFAFAVLFVVVVKALPVREGELPGRRAAIFLLAAVLVPALLTRPIEAGLDNLPPRWEEYLGPAVVLLITILYVLRYVRSRS